MKAALQPRMASTSEPRAVLLLPAPELEDFTAIYQRWFRDVSRWAHALGGPEADVEDLAQEVFLVVRRKLGAFQGGNLGAWLYRITAHTVSDYRRRAWFRRLFHGERGRLPRMHACGEAPDELLERKQAYERFERIAQRLGVKYREVLVLSEIEGYSSAEIATLLGMPEATVRTRLHRARKQFVALVVRCEEAS